MLCRLVVITALLASVPCLASSAHASDTCQRYTGGKCKVGQTTQPRNISKGAVTHQATQAPARGNHKGRDQYTPAQREKFLADARALCRRKYGAPSRLYRIDYKRMEVWCEPPSF